MIIEVVGNESIVARRYGDGSSNRNIHTCILARSLLIWSNFGKFLQKYLSIS